MNDLFGHHLWFPLKCFGLTSSFWAVNSDTLIFTWVTFLALCVLIVLGRIFIKNTNSIAGYITETYVRTIMDSVSQTLEEFNYKHSAFIGSLFTYIFLCNIVVILPFCEEPTKDLNTTFALAITSFCYVQYQGIRTLGVWGYIKELSQPIFLFFPLEVMGKLATIISLSFRLFGNIFGGSVISGMWHQAISGSILAQLAGIVLGLNLVVTLFFGLFEGLIQAFVFSTLSLTYLAMATHGAHQVTSEHENQKEIELS